MTATGTIRVRFAPSPTGRLHVGGARTALFNWLYARHHGGTMVLRIEDTDVERSTRTAEAALLEDLRWLGLDWDEGPDLGGPHAPYRQSERLDLYAARARKLLDGGEAFRCFCTDEDLARKRARRLEMGGEPRYDGTCRELDAATAGRRAAAGEPHTLRFHVPERAVAFHDRLRGNMHFEPRSVGDFVLLRSTGLPTYNFACVVDDAAMRISHVIRGEDHLSNTLRQVLLYEALGERMPEFAHVSLILDENRAKLTKREGREGTYVDGYRADGWLPEALVNFLALLGWSSPTGDEMLSRERLRAEFDLDRVSRAAAIFDVHKLRHLGGAHLRAADWDALVPLAGAFLRAAELDAPPAEILRWLRAFRDGIACMAELPGLVLDVLHPGAPEPEAAASLQAPGARRLLESLSGRLARHTTGARAADGAAFKAMVQECGKELGLKGRELFMPVRAALSGRTHGPELPLLFDVLGPERAQARLTQTAR